MDKGTQHDANKVDVDAGKALSQCMFSQYTGCVIGILGSTGYSIARKPPNGLMIMLVAGGAGTLLDLLYGWNVGCRSEVIAWREQQAKQEKSQTE